MATPLTKPLDHTENSYIKAQVLALNEHIEEDITLLIEGTIINCFISYCPYDIEIGKTYNVELTMNLSDDYEIEKVEPRAPLIEKISPGYAYLLYGNLCDTQFHSFASLNDEDIHYDHPEYNEHFIKLKVDRIDVSFR
ncbi:hypothetical protein [Pseudomonas lactis]|uniref:Uncharacterized protein n=1 Tax=Pseudomonas lactis TaxID=1615674 RepID=A0A7Y1MJC7_9PSED|nr:hypothetical protein [Pseudomonas lactis]MBK3445128.1 hypothetical protein [Pseudomonas lactis]NNA82841.1 hypothetical protein [Pseudomonas lactis]